MLSRRFCRVGGVEQGPVPPSAEVHVHVFRTLVQSVYSGGPNRLSWSLSASWTMRCLDLAAVEEVLEEEPH